MNVRTVLEVYNLVGNRLCSNSGFLVAEMIKRKGPIPSNSMSGQQSRSLTTAVEGQLLSMCYIYVVEKIKEYVFLPEADTLMRYERKITFWKVGRSWR